LYKDILEFEIMRVYRHYKGNNYYVFGLATHTETNELMVIYQALYSHHAMFIRPYKMFIEEVTQDQKNITRQKYRFEPHNYK
jgi:hypothetical protein